MARSPSAAVAAVLFSLISLGLLSGCGGTNGDDQALAGAASPASSSTSASSTAITAGASETTLAPASTTEAPGASTSTSSTTVLPASGTSPAEESVAETGAPPTTTSSSTTSETVLTTTVAPEVLTRSEDPSELVLAPGTGPVVGSGTTHRFSIEVERATGFDPATEAKVIEDVLTDARSWIGVRDVAFQRVDTDPQLRILLATPPTVDAMCAPLRTNGYFSCREGNRVILNSVRWTEAVEAWAATLVEYRQYLVNHEVGHYLGRGHVGCPAAGAPAPVMMQQTKGIGSCSPNSWPNP